MTDEELNRLAIKSKEGDQVALSKLLIELEPRIKGVAAGWKIPGYDREDIQSEATIAIFSAVESYDPVKGGGYFWPWANRIIRNTLGRIKKPASKVADGEMQNEFIENDADPNQEEPSEALFSPEDVTLSWPYLSHAEKRAVLASLSSVKWTEIARLEGVSKQAIHKAMYTARLKIVAVKSGEKPLRRARPSALDYLLPGVIKSLKG